MSMHTLTAYVDHWADHRGDRIWLRDLQGDSSQDYSWAEGKRQIDAVACQLEALIGHRSNIMLLSRNRAHWVLADMAIARSGNVTIPLFTTQTASVAEYIAETTESRVLFLGESLNWDAIKSALPEDLTIITLPGVNIEASHIKWEDMVRDGAGDTPTYEPGPTDTISIVFTSGTTGMPKGVIQTHESNLIPLERAYDFIDVPEDPRYFSYLPLSHLAERQIVEYASIFRCGEITFNESLETLTRDMARSRPHVFFGAPRVWEQLQQGVLHQFGGVEQFNEAFRVNPEGVGISVLASLGLDQANFCLTASAPTPPPLIEWWRSLGLMLVEAFGQTEAMSLFLSNAEINRIGSIGKAVGDVEFKISDEQELLVRCSGLTPGYYKNPEKTAELFQNGWLHTGDKAKVDEDGYVYITGRVKDYFKTVQGKFIAPPPIEGMFAENADVEQQCLIGRGFAKTVMVAVLTESAKSKPTEAVEASVAATVEVINESVEKHARIGAVIISKEPWTIENEVLTPTLKVRRDHIDARFADKGRELASESAENRFLLIHWE